MSIQRYDEEYSGMSHIIKKDDGGYVLYTDHLTDKQAALDAQQAAHAAEVEELVNRGAALSNVLASERDAAVRERDVAVEALRAEISVREAQRQRHAGTFHLTTMALIALWDDADSQARATLAKIEGERKHPYGYCPVCGAPGMLRERRPNGNDICENVHFYPSKDAVMEQKL